MTTDEREAIYNHCARLCRAEAEKLASRTAKLALLRVADRINDHKALPVKYP
mgnify:CR=1 FL=1